MIASADTCSVYTFNIEQALDKYFRPKLCDADHSICSELLDKLTRRLQFNVVLVDAESFNIHVAYETINNRGRKLSNLERLKNRVMFLTTMLQVSTRPGEPEDARVQRQTKIRNQMRHSSNRTWRTIYNWLGKDHKMQLSDDEFLRNHTLIYFKIDTGEAGAVETTLFDECFTVQAIRGGELTTKRLEEYLLSLEEGVVCWFHLHSAERVPYKHAYYLEKIDNLRWTAFKPLLLAAYMRLLNGHEEQIADLTPLESLLEPAAALLREVERFIVLIYLVSGRRSHIGRKDFLNLAHRLYRAEDELKGDAASAVDYTARYVRTRVVNHWEETDDGDYIYEDPQFAWEGWLNLETFKTHIQQALGQPNAGYYGLEWTKYLLFEYEE